MGRIDGYIIRQVGLAVVYGTVGLTFVIWLTQSLRFIEYIVSRGLPVLDFVALVALMIPTFLAIVLPFALFFSVLFIYNKLTADAELVVCRAVGFSQLGLARPAVILGALVSGICYILALWLMPLSFTSFKDWQYRIRNDYSAVVLQEGVFSEVVDGITVYIRARGPNGELLGPMIHDNRDPRKPVTVLAESGALVSGQNGPSIVMVRGNRQQVERDTGKLSMLYFDQWSIELTSDRDGPAPELRFRDANERFLHELFFPETPKVMASHGDSFRAEGHQRLVGPLYPLLFVLLAMAALLCGEFNRRGQVRRVIVAAACVMAVQGVGLGLHNLAAKVPMVIPLMYANVLVPGGLCIYLLMGGRILPRRRRATPDLGASAAAPAE